MTIDRLEQQCDTIEKRITVMGNKVTDSKATALAKKKAGDIRGATLALKQMKMYEGEITKLHGQQIMLEQQKLTIQSTHADVDVVNSLKAGNQAISAMNAQADVDSIAELQDDMAETMQEVQERQDLFAAVAEEGHDEALAELDELEAEMMAGELEGLDIGPMGNIPIAAPAQPVAAQPAAA
mmetsp:Transcript_16037/g.20296  ORF Transcript_16037/g.20296 Transcript_16037/m.20296 type:complete len:182 (-) Transcript_16037:148-693(-)|eukprot:CAMPEP_0170469926 /NCGR_PEP_ID=MMETSP0123-20130129/12578_1 /TAXON_ID=182087 /ORGANISM="Favella ehrenbergii, Strain Fehren 1" /LENGTH=181 /DNA_ID=CAMNT_0010736927 /DNA_START=103 /DNA_END=648 /DNA_ORIENTATION=-